MLQSFTYLSGYTTRKLSPPWMECLVSSQEAAAQPTPLARFHPLQGQNFRDSRSPCTGCQKSTPISVISGSSMPRISSFLTRIENPVPKSLISNRIITLISLVIDRKVLHWMECVCVVKGDKHGRHLFAQLVPLLLTLILKLVACQYFNEYRIKFWYQWFL